MVKHTQSNRLNCLSAYEHFAGLALNGLSQDYKTALHTTYQFIWMPYRFGKS